MSRTRQCRCSTNKASKEENKIKERIQPDNTMQRLSKRCFETRSFNYVVNCFMLLRCTRNLLFPSWLFFTRFLSLCRPSFRGNVELTHHKHSKYILNRCWFLLAICFLLLWRKPMERSNVITICCICLHRFISTWSLFNAISRKCSRRLLSTRRNIFLRFPRLKRIQYPVSSILNINRSTKEKWKIKFQFEAKVDSFEKSTVWERANFLL